MKRLLLAMALGLVATVARADSINMVVNGDFSLGTVGISSDYAYRAPGLGEMNLWDPGVYSVDTSALDNHGLWETGGDHTTGAGAFMLVNGRTDAPSTVWSQTFSTIPGWTYEFSLWAKNLCCTGVDIGRPGPELSFSINDMLFSSCTTDGPSVWLLCSGLFTATSRTATLGVEDGSVIYDGNDFGLDDIYFGHETDLTPAPEPMSLVLLGSGLTLAAWRRRKTAGVVKRGR